MRILHIDFLNNGGPYWARALNELADLYVFVSPNKNEIFHALKTEPTHIVCGGGFYGGIDLSILSEYRKSRPETVGFSYYGDARLDEQSTKFYMDLYKTNVVDVIYCASVNAVELFKQNDCYAEWAGHPVDQNIFYPDNSVHEIYDWCFTGNHQTGRHPTLNAAKSASSNFAIRGLGHHPETSFSSYEETAILYRQSKIVLSITLPEFQNLENYFSDRLPMGMLCGKFNLINYQPGFENIFTRGIHLDWYSSHEEMIDKIKYYLEHSELRNEIGKNGYALARNFWPMNYEISFLLDRAKQIHSRNLR